MNHSKEAGVFSSALNTSFLFYYMPFAFASRTEMTVGFSSEAAGAAGLRGRLMPWLFMNCSRR